MGGTEGEDESTENAMRPPQSVVISSTEADEIPKPVDVPLLTGSVVAADVHAQTVSQPIAQSQLQYVMGPDGQMYAYQKPPFNWKHFCLGFFIPVGIIFASLIIALTYLGAEDAQLFLQIPSAVGFIFQGLVLFYLLGAELLINYKLTFKKIS